jgi:hypothetical protein
MDTQAEKEHISVAGRHGYLMFDEMSIQVHKNIVCTTKCMKIKKTS